MRTLVAAGALFMVAQIQPLGELGIDREIFTVVTATNAADGAGRLVGLPTNVGSIPATCLYCETWVEDRGFANYWAMLDVWGDCESEEWEVLATCALCSMLPGNPQDCDGPMTGWENGPFYTDSSAYEWIASGNDCEDMSCQLSFTPPALEELQEMVANNDVGALATLIADSDGAFWYNAERRALQASGCGGALLLHVPVPVQIGSRIDKATRTTSGRMSTLLDSGGMRD